MSILQDIKRLIYYAKGLGLKVRFRQYIPRSRDQAYWDEGDNGPIVTIFYTKRTSYRQILLSLVHEIGHQKDYIHRGRKDEILFVKAMNKIDENPSHRTKKHRKIILDDETRATRFWDDIYKDTGLSINRKYIDKQREVDLFPYQFFYHNGRYPYMREAKEFLKQAKKRWGF